MAPVSLRLPDLTIARLAARARGIGTPPRTLAQRYVEEGLRMDEHPLVRFTDGPAGRRATLVGTGLDVWEAIEIVRDHDGDASAAAQELGLPVGLVHAAIAYYGAFTAEIDALVDENERLADEGRAAWLAGQAALGR